MNFASLRHQISHFVHEAHDPLTKPQLMEICDLAENEKQMANAIYNMVKADELTPHPAPEGAGKSVRFAYGPAKNKPGAEPQEDAGGGGRRPREEGRVSSVEGKTNKRRAKHAKRRKHKVRKPTAPAPNSSRRRSAPRERPLQTPPHGAMWALRSDGAFVLLGDELGLVVPREVARALVDFIRTLDEGKA